MTTLKTPTPSRIENIRLTDEQQKILAFCKEFTGPTKIGQELLGYDYACASSKVSPKCKHLVSLGLMERNKQGHYRAIQMPVKE